MKNRYLKETEEKRGFRTIFGTKLGIWILMFCVLAVYVSPLHVSAEQPDLQLGSKGTAFHPGETYLVPLSLRKASNIEKESAAADCTGKLGKLTVAEDGTAQLEVELRSVVMGKVKDYADNVAVYQGTEASGEKIPAAVKETQEVTVTDENEQVKKTVPKSITFTVPEAAKASDGVFLNMYVAAMGYAPDVFLQIEYDRAVSINDASMNYTTDVAKVPIKQFGKYDVNVRVSVAEGKIQDLDIQGSGFGGTDATAKKNQRFLNVAIGAMKEKLIGLYKNDDKKLNEVDTKTGATVSSAAIKEATMKALKVENINEEIADAPTQALQSGVYSIDMENRTTGVDHNLLGADKKATGCLRVDKGGKMWLSYKMVSDTEESPLHVLGYNGYYLHNQPGNLTKKGVTCETEIMNVPTLGEQSVVTDITVPLENLRQKYSGNVYVYVDAMKNISGNVSGVEIDKGKFNVNTVLTLHWDTLKKLSADGDNFSALEDGIYAVQGSMVQTDRKTPSMSDKAINHNVMLMVKDGVYQLHMDFDGMKIGTRYGYLQSMKYYQSGYTKNKHGNPSGNKKPVTVKSYQQNKDGTRVRDSLGTDYPNRVYFPMIKEVLYGDEFVPLQVFIPIMDSMVPGSGTKNIYLKLNKASIRKTTEKDPVFRERGETKLDKVKKTTIQGISYKVKGKTAMVETATKTIKKANIAATVKIAGKKYTVTEIGANAFKGRKQLKTVSIGKNVRIIGSKSFYGTKKLRKVSFKGTKLVKIGSGAFKGIYKKAVFKAPKSKLKKYTVLIKKAGAPKKAKYKKA